MRRRRRRRKRLFDATLLAVVVSRPLQLWHSYSSKTHPHKKKSS